MLKKCVACYLVAAVFVLGVAPRIDAAFSPSEALNMSSEARTGDMERIRIVLENKLVAQRLRDLGYTTDEIMTKLSQMTDEQIHSFAQKLDDLRVGGDGLGVIIAVLLIVVLVLVILKLTGHKIAIN
jgi:hypothetical protein